MKTAAEHTQHQIEQRNIITAEQIDLTDTNNMQRDTAESKPFDDTETVETSTSGITLTDQTVNTDNGINFLNKEDVIEEVQSDTDKNIQIQNNQIMEDPAKLVENRSDPVLQQDSSYHAEIAREGNDITIVLYEPDSRFDSEEETVPVPLVEPDTAEFPVAPVMQVHKQESSKEIPDKIIPINAEEAVEVEIYTSPDAHKAKILVKSGQVKNSKPTNHKKTVIIHIVVKGDTLWAIAKRYVNNPFRYPELARLSRIKNPDLIYPGNRIWRCALGEIKFGTPNIPQS